MAEGRIDLAAARILITNDDGIHAPGLKVLERVALGLSDDVWVVAPESEQSAASHALTLRRPLRIRHLDARRFAVDGTPTDCVLVALHRIMADKCPTLVLSGINHGGNLGEDVIYSGTVAAALEAALLGVPAVAFSQRRTSDGPIHWATAERFAPEVLGRLAAFDWPPDVLFNVNFPALPPEEVRGLRACHQGRRVAGVQIVDGTDPGGRPYVWIGDYSDEHGMHPDSDLTAVGDGVISVTPLQLDLTHRTSLEPLHGLFARELMEPEGTP
jgi:5'-nucleotidase